MIIFSDNDYWIPEWIAKLPTWLSLIVWMIVSMGVVLLSTAIIGGLLFLVIRAVASCI